MVTSDNLFTKQELQRIYRVSRPFERPLKLKAKKESIPVYDQTENYCHVIYLKCGEEITVLSEWYHPIYQTRIGILDDNCLVVLNESDFDGWNT